MLDNTGAIALGGDTQKNLDPGATLNNSGTITDAGSNFWGIAGTLNNLAGGTIDMTTVEEPR